MSSKEKKQARSRIQISETKNPIAVQQISSKREPRSFEAPDLMQMKASWRVSRVQLVDPYGWHNLSSQSIAYLREKLSSFESMTWNEIFTIGKKRNHSIPVQDLKCPEAKKWLRNNMQDQTELWTLRLSGPERVWGVFAEGAYLIIFWDPNHQIMPSLR